MGLCFIGIELTGDRSMGCDIELSILSSLTTGFFVGSCLDLLWVFKSLLPWKVLGHSSHLKGSSPRCLFMWVSKFLLFFNLAPHISQENTVYSLAGSGAVSGDLFTKIPK